MSGKGLFFRNRDGSPWYQKTFRITTVRIVSQVLFFALFMFLLWVTWFSRLGGYPVSLFLEVDPLVHQLGGESVDHFLGLFLDHPGRQIEGIALAELLQ